MNRQPIPLTVRCGNIQPTTISSTTTLTTTVVTTIVTSTQHSTISFTPQDNISLKISQENIFVAQSTSTINSRPQKDTTGSIDPSKNNRFFYILK